MEDRFVIFTGTICSTYLNRMRDYAMRDLENETKKGKTNFLKFSKIVEKIYNENKIESLNFSYDEIRKIEEKNRIIFSLPFSGSGELLKVSPDTIDGLKLPVMRKEEEIIFSLKETEFKDEHEIKEELINLLTKINEICSFLKKEIENYNKDLANMLKEKSVELYEKISFRTW
ncbi:hypothetical protein C4N20_12935 [Fusobacterium ulcerans]|uniref:Uncharacterized protein n=1 Tax=Fusobacterium ulcerans TaxID=861 RepID=A0AAX2J975_9FUSO|nr:hypothetical protein [Fusobacterium ulcerans]AVQ28948.1 hypothetical protein C4N20_12935 [Fusobacterium ulcerans]EFS26415.1 hypothetical protein FUAG_01930 [Fusobacterium ulcerans ATCC 49185]SQJ01241.1 Uncharacterised protein [Fusobacterium ulcerans]